MDIEKQLSNSDNQKERAMFTIIYAGEPFPETMTKAIFLAGPTPRPGKDGKLTATSWRPEALNILERIGYDGHVFVPENRPGSAKVYDFDYHDNYIWETKGLHRADVIVFWVPRDLATMPAFTTNVEFGEWFTSGKVVFGAPEDPTKPGAGEPLPKNKYLELKAREYELPFFRALSESLAHACEMVGEGALRTGGECDVNLHVWTSRPFGLWYQNLKAAGNTLAEAHIRWCRTSDKKGVVTGWVLDPKIWIASEDRFKTADSAVSRSDLSVVMLWQKNTVDPIDSPVVLVREFRSPGRTPDGFIHELPGGSTLKENVPPNVVAQEEVHEETGLLLDLSRFIAHGSRQLAGTFSSHHAQLFSVTLTEEEMKFYKAQEGVPRGNPKDSERTTIEIRSAREIIAQELVDWTTLGMILQVITDSK